MNDQIPAEMIPELVDIDEENFHIRYNQVVNEMKIMNTWYSLDGMFKGRYKGNFFDYKFKKIKSKKCLGLGRSTFYDLFLEELESRFSTPFFQSDYMVWVNPSNPYPSLFFFIHTSDVIHFSLEGVNLEDIKKCVDFGRCAMSRNELNTPYMTLWEINQILFSSYVQKTIWHIRGDMDKNELLTCLHGLVQEKNITVDFK